MFQKRSKTMEKYDNNVLLNIKKVQTKDEIMPIHYENLPMQ